MKKHVEVDKFKERKDLVDLLDVYALQSALLQASKESLDGMSSSNKSELIRLARIIN
jgi:hypothetical protein